MPKYKMPDGEEIEAPDRCEVNGAHLDPCLSGCHTMPRAGLGSRPAGRKHGLAD